MKMFSISLASLASSEIALAQKSHKSEGKATSFDVLARDSLSLFVENFYFFSPTQ